MRGLLAVLGVLAGLATIMPGINDIQWSVAVIGHSRWRVARLARWVFDSLSRALEPLPEIRNAELRENGVTVLALTYPRQPLAPLAALFRTGEAELVSLEDPFNEAVKRQGCKALFYDSFGGNFGHLTKRGNELVADQLARAIRCDALEAHR